MNTFLTILGAVIAVGLGAVLAAVVAVLALLLALAIAARGAEHVDEIDPGDAT